MAHWVQEAMGSSSAPPHIPDRVSIQHHPDGNSRTTGCLNCGRDISSSWNDGDEDRSGSWGRWGHGVSSPNGKVTAYRQTCEAQDLGSSEGTHITPETMDEMSREHGTTRARAKRAVARVKHFTTGRNQDFIPKNAKPPF